MATNKELEAKVAELEAQLKAKETELAEKTQPAVPQVSVLDVTGRREIVPYQGTETVKLRLFKDNGRYKDPLYVAINGRNWIIKRGVDVEVPVYVKEYIDQQLTEEQIIWDKVAKEEEEYERATAAVDAGATA